MLSLTERLSKARMPRRETPWDPYLLEFDAIGFPEGKTIAHTVRMEGIPIGPPVCGLPISADHNWGPTFGRVEYAPEGFLAVAGCRRCGARNERLADVRLDGTSSVLPNRAASDAERVCKLVESADAWCIRHRCSTSAAHPFTIPNDVRDFLESYIVGVAPSFQRISMGFLVVACADRRIIGLPLTDVVVKEVAYYYALKLQHISHFNADDGANLNALLALYAFGLRELVRERNLTPFVAALIARTPEQDQFGQRTAYVSVISRSQAFSGILGREGHQPLQHLRPHYHPVFPLSGMLADRASVR